MPPTNSSTALTLATLEAFDPYAPPGSSERRFCCPLPACGDKRIDATHRSLTVNMTTGLWTCHRCHAAGCLLEFVTNRPVGRRVRGVAAARRAFALRPEPCPAPPSASTWQVQWKTTLPLAASRAADYLAGRGLPVDLASAAGVRWAPDWCGRPAVVFPMRDQQGTIIAANGRYIDGRSDPKTRTLGPRSLGVFTVLPDALQADPLVLVEGPADCLALAAVGVPAIALVATAAPHWLVIRAALRRVLIALDADDRQKPAVAQALAKLHAALAALGARCKRLRPAGDDDWAADLKRLGPERFAAVLAPLLPEFIPSAALSALEGPAAADRPHTGTYRRDVDGPRGNTQTAVSGAAAAPPVRTDPPDVTLSQMVPCSQGCGRLMLVGQIRCIVCREQWLRTARTTSRPVQSSGATY
jgi:hypothetical protein